MGIIAGGTAQAMAPGCGFGSLSWRSQISGLNVALSVTWTLIWTKLLFLF